MNETTAGRHRVDRTDAPVPILKSFHAVVTIKLTLCVLYVCACLDGLPSSALSSSGPGSAPPPSSTLDNFAPPPPSSFLPQPPPSAAPGKLPYPNCGPPTSSQGQPQPLAGALRPGHGQVMDGMGGFMPQQSQVFVFSTSMANQAAEAVERGLCRTIIDFHIEQPRTRQFLQVSLTPSSKSCSLLSSVYICQRDNLRGSYLPKIT